MINIKTLLLFLILYCFCATLQAQTHDFNGIKLQKSDIQPYKNAEILQDSLGNQYINVTLLMTNEGILIGEKGTMLENYILIPTKSINLTSADLQDIFTFINSRDLINRMSKTR